MIFQAPGCKKIRFAAAFRRFLRRIGWHVSLSDNDIRDILRRSRNAMRKRTAGIPGGNIVNSTEKAYSSTGKENLSVGTDENGSVRKGTEQNGVRFAVREFDDVKRAAEAGKLNAFIEKYKKPLLDFEKGTLRRDEQFELGETPDALTMLGVEQLPVSMSGNLFYKAAEKHGLTIDELRQIPEALYNPVMIFDSSDRSTNPDGMVVLTQIKDGNGKPVIAALNIGKQQKNHTVNDIASIHGRNAQQIIDWISEGFLRYSHKKRALAFARFHRLSLPKKATISERNNDIIIDESPDVKPDSENNLRFSVSPVYTGSAADYDKPSLQYIGTGEGAQVFGWGLYGADNRKIAEWYAAQDVDRKVFRISANGVPLFNDDGDIQLVNVIEQLDPEEMSDVDYSEMEAALQGLLDEYLDGRDLTKAVQRVRDSLPNNKFSEDAVDFIEGAIREGTITASSRKNLYRQTFWPDKQENLLLWNEDVPQEQIQQIIDAAGGLLSESDRRRHEELSRKDFKNEITAEEKSELSALDRRGRIATLRYGNVFASRLYGFLAEEFGSPKAASEFLYRAGIDGIKYPASSHGTGDGSKGWNYVAFSDKDIRVDEHIRFSYPGLREMTEEDFAANPKVEAWAKVMMPEVSKGLAASDIDAAERFLTENGIDIDHVRDGALVRQAWLLAGSMYRQYRTKRNGFEAMEFYRSSHPLFDYIANFASSPDWKINPGSKYRGSGFSGTFLSPEFRKNSGALKQRKNESNADFARRQREQTEKLDNAPGIRLDEVATAYANEYGLDAISVEKEIMDLLGTLTRRDILSEYSRFKRESAFADRELERRYAEEWMLSENARIENEAAALLENAGNIEITPEWIDNNRPVYKVLYNMLFDKTAPYSPSKSDMAAINAAMRLANAPDAASDVAENTRIFNEQLQRQIDGTLPSGHVYQLGMPSAVLRSTGIPDLPIELASSRLAEKAKQQNHPFDISEIKNLPRALQNPVAVFRYGDANKAQNIIVDIQQGNKNFLVGLHLNADNNGLTVNSIRGLFPKDTEKWLQWIQDGKALYLDKEKIRTMITQQRTNLADVGYLDLDSINNIVENFENASQDARKSARQIAAAYKAAREQAFNEFREKLRDFKQSLNADRVDAEKLRQEAFDLLEDKIPPEYRGERYSPSHI